MVRLRHFNIEDIVNHCTLKYTLSGFWIRMLNSGHISHHSRLLNANHVEPVALLHCDTPHQQGLDRKQITELVPAQARPWPPSLIR